MITNRKQNYKRMDPIDHILNRSDMYVGSTRLRDSEESVALKDDQRIYSIQKKTISSSPAILRIFIEPLSNAIDNVHRSIGTKNPCTIIKITIDTETGKTSVWNNGNYIPIEINEYELYEHSMVFGELRTGSNYDDDEERFVSGRNGFGVKLCNVFSKDFTVKGCDPENKKILTQKWTNNMKDTTGPKITTTKNVKPFTEVTWYPDLKRFGLESYTQDIIDLYTKFVIDSAMLTKVNMYLNNELISVKNVSDYSKLYKTPTEERIYIKDKNHEVVLTTCNEFQSISFVNGVYTKLGGKHVDAWTEAFFRPIVNKFNTPKRVKEGSPKINIADVKQFFRIFIVSSIDKPEFDGQDKNKLESPSVKAEVKPSHINSIMKWSITEKIENVLRRKDMNIIQKIEKGKKGKPIIGLDQANNSNSKTGYKCSLFICEGLSARTFILAGLDVELYGVSGKDWFGILPLTGKFLNVRNSDAKTIASNVVIDKIIRSIGLKHEVDYTKDSEYKKLLYGRVIIATDADVDGIHIEGLLLNLLHNLYPSILERKESFVVSMKTPIAKITSKGKNSEKVFYDERNFNEWLATQKTKQKVKYYKGLGTWKPTDVPSNFGSKMVEYKHDDSTDEIMRDAFYKKQADVRKDWLKKYDGTSSFSLDKQPNVCIMNISDFVSEELIKFTFANCERTIPSGIDGLKKSQRKILYAVKKRNLKYTGDSLKVAQLAGVVAEKSNYHHGEQNLHETIYGMAHEFPGSNNIPLLYRDGGMGTRLQLGKDAASARYTYTKMDEMTSLIFRDEDEPLLTPVNDDGDLVEPEYYVPIIPMILSNGSAGIGTGWSSTVPCYNPLDLIDCVKVWLENDGEVILEDTEDLENTCSISMFPDIKPWYRGFKGDVEYNTDKRYITYGVVKEIDNGFIEISEIPIGMSSDKFKEFLEGLREKGKIGRIKTYCNPSHDYVNFQVYEKEGFRCDLNSLKLHSYISMTNMVMFNKDKRLVKYKDIDTIIDDFCKVRYDYYVKRKVYQLKIIEIDLIIARNKARFIKEVIDRTIDMMNKEESQVNIILKNKNYDTDPRKSQEECDNYDYLWTMQIRTFTSKKISQLLKDQEELQLKLDELKNKSEKDIWIEELNELGSCYKKWMVKIEQESRKAPIKKKRNMAPKKK